MNRVTQPTFEQTLLDAEGSAPGLSNEEVCAILDIDFDELEEAEQKALTRAMVRGRAIANKTAVDYLFNSMRTKGGERACVDYLRRFGADWPSDGEYDSNKGGGTFTVNLG